ncbi:hypothetical protein [Brevundimonas diminuta]|uniref:hypothetical protein n=1 Tax=Brevundimonas diminuta TaxID=293 RepID=UPI0025A5C777|nr:hypothetical protein [Brevundimonas diminuta]MDM8354007.1 hypothetical protein [Brevundimonas diminuta]
MQVEAALDNPPSQALAGARTPDDVLRITQEYRAATQGRVETYRREISVEGPGAQQLQQALQGTLFNSNAPRPLQDQVFRCPNDHPGCD